MLPRDATYSTYTEAPADKMAEYPPGGRQVEGLVIIGSRRIHARCARTRSERKCYCAAALPRTLPVELPHGLDEGTRTMLRYQNEASLEDGAPTPRVSWHQRLRVCALSQRLRLCRS
jgi:hypothetical protein